MGGLKPNDFGLFDVHGNASTWCQESYRAYSQGEEITDVKEDDLVIDNTRYRVLRGGTFGYSAYFVRSAARYAVVPSYPSFNGFGFRVVRRTFR